MKPNILRILILAVATSGLCSCQTPLKDIPVNVAYTGHKAGYNYTVAYGKTTGLGIVLNQK